MATGSVWWLYDARYVALLASKIVTSCTFIPASLLLLCVASSWALDSLAGKVKVSRSGKYTKFGGANTSIAPDILDRGAKSFPRPWFRCAFRSLRTPAKSSTVTQSRCALTFHATPCRLSSKEMARLDDNGRMRAKKSRMKVLGWKAGADIGVGRAV